MRSGKTYLFHNAHSHHSPILRKEVVMQDHPAAALFPTMGEDEFQALVEDIRENGQREPIVRHEDKVLDGRHRLRACQLLGIEPMIREWNGECGTPEAFAISMNLHRRHLTTSQRSLIAAAMATMKGEVGKIADHPSNEKDAETPGLSARRAAEAMQVSTRTVEDAKTVLRRGTPQEVEAVKSGSASVSNVARKIRQGKTARQRITPKKLMPKIRAAPRRTRERELISRVQECVITLSVMPPAAELVGPVLSAKAAQSIVDRLPRAADWIADFCAAFERARADWLSKS